MKSTLFGIASLMASMVAAQQVPTCLPNTDFSFPPSGFPQSYPAAAGEVLLINGCGASGGRGSTGSGNPTFSGRSSRACILAAIPLVSAGALTAVVGVSGQDGVDEFGGSSSGGGGGGTFVYSGSTLLFAAGGGGGGTNVVTGAAAQLGTAGGNGNGLGAGAAGTDGTGGSAGTAGGAGGGGGWLSAGGSAVNGGFGGHQSLPPGDSAGGLQQVVAGAGGYGGGGGASPTSGGGGGGFSGGGGGAGGVGGGGASYIDPRATVYDHTLNAGDGFLQICAIPQTTPVPSTGVEAEVALGLILAALGAVALRRSTA